MKLKYYILNTLQFSSNREMGSGKAAAVTNSKFE